MPKITQYEAPELGLRPTEVGITATAAAARRVGAEYSEAAAAQRATAQNVAETVQGIGNVAVRFAEHQEIATGMAESARITDGLTRSKDAQIASLDPNDPAYGQKVEVVTARWREQTLEPTLEDFGKGFMTTKGQQWAQHYTSSTRESMFRQTTADVATAAGVGIQNNIKNFTIMSSNTALRNPELVEKTLLPDAQRNIAALVASSPIKGTQAAKFQSDLLLDTQRQIVKAGAVGAIQKSADPEATAQEWIGKYPQFINGAEAVTLGNNARQQIRAREADTHRAELRAKEARQAQSTDLADQYAIEARMRNPDLANDPIAQKVLNDPNMTKRDRDNVLNLLTAQLKPQAEARVSNDTYMALLAEIRPGSNDVDNEALMQRAWDARTTNKLNDSHFDRIRNEIVARKTPEGRALADDRKAFMVHFGAKIDGAMVGSYHSALGKQQMAIIDAELDQREAQMRKDKKNPQELYRRGSPDYYDKDDAAADKYAVSMQKALIYQAAIGNKGTAQGMTREDPIIIPKGMTPEQVQTIGLGPGMWYIAPNETKPRQIPKKVLP